MNESKYKECLALLNAWFECQGAAEQGTFNRARWAIKQLANDLGLKVSEECKYLDEIQELYPQ